MTKRERLARTACFAESQKVRGLCGCAGPDECVSYEAEGQYFAMIDAILEALREPSEGMLWEATCEYQNHVEGRDPEAMFKALWEAMIDHILNEEA